MKPGDFVTTTKQLRMDGDVVMESGTRCMVFEVTEGYVKVLPPTGTEMLFITDRTAIEKVPQFVGPVGFQTETNCDATD